MRTSETVEKTQGVSGKNRWFQMGLLTAGAAAPLIARWRALRAAERAEALREQANERWSEALAWAAQARPQDAIPAAIQERLPQAQESLRQISANARDALRRRTLAGDAEPPAPVVTPSLPATSNRRVNAALWAVGVGVGVIAAGAIAYVVLRNRFNANNDDDTLVEIPLTAVAPEEQAAAEQPTTVPTDGPAITEESPAEEPQVAEQMPFNESEMEGAVYVGNILTQVYHPVDSKRLPAPEHRIYFATQAEAEDAGYRPDAGESAAFRRSDTSGRND